MKTKQILAKKLSPERVHVSPKFRAILGCLLEQDWTEPELTAVMVTSDGFLMGMEKGDYGYNLFLGTRTDLERNLKGVAETAGLTPKQKKHLMSLCPGLS